MKPRRSFEVRHVQLDITTENGKGYFVIGDEVDLRFPDHGITAPGVVRYFKQKENFQRIYVQLDEPVIIKHTGNKYSKKKNG